MFANVGLPGIIVVLVFVFLFVLIVRKLLR